MLRKKVGIPKARLGKMTRDEFIITVILDSDHLIQAKEFEELINPILIKNGYEPFEPGTLFKRFLLHTTFEGGKVKTLASLNLLQQNNT